LSKELGVLLEKTLLLVEDEPGLVMMLSDLLTAEGYRVETAGDGQQALNLACQKDFSLVILDVMLPAMNGFEVCQELRQRGVRTPILMLTARGQLADKVAGLKLGADDYLTKPFEPSELLARMEALLRRAPSDPMASCTSFQFGSVLVDFRTTQVKFQGTIVELSAREYALLCYFARNIGTTLSREKLLRDVWEYETGIETRTVDVHIGQLRQKLEIDPKHPAHFLTIRGLGYRFVAEAGK
jgi:two-component system, OmpR family, alkaline phosphatase synthesis response regulator PhoP